MNKTVLITGSTDGIGLATAKSLVKLGHSVLLHGRNREKLAATKIQLSEINNQVPIETYAADLSVIEEVKLLATEISKNHKQLDVLINNAGVYVVPKKITVDGLDMRYMVNTIAPYLLTQKLLALLGSDGRVVNLSSAAQSPVNPDELTKPSELPDSVVYAKSKLALTMWSHQMGLSLGEKGPIVVAVNPASLLGSKMVNKAYGIAGKSLQIGADILVRAALSHDFAMASGKYFDNDIGQFTSAHPDANDPEKTSEITKIMNSFLASY